MGKLLRFHFQPTTVSIYTREVKREMAATATTLSKKRELIRAFLIDLEREYGLAHRQVFEAKFQLGKPSPASCEIEVSPSRARVILDESMSFARKWFGADGVRALALKAAA